VDLDFQLLPLNPEIKIKESAKHELFISCMILVLFQKLQIFPLHTSIAVKNLSSINFNLILIEIGVILYNA
jgi:hypothetical protein